MVSEAGSAVGVLLAGSAVVLLAGSADVVQNTLLSGTLTRESVLHKGHTPMALLYGHQDSWKGAHPLGEFSP